MKKAIIITLATAWLVAPAIAGATDAKDTTAQPSVQQNDASAAQDAQRRGSAADKQDDKNKGLSRNSEDCNKGCIGGNPP
jgi:Ni/Co efflux regulator RcnB